MQILLGEIPLLGKVPVLGLWRRWLDRENAQNTVRLTAKQFMLSVCSLDTQNFVINIY
jgi:hypothetical protein